MKHCCSQVVHKTGLQQRGQLLQVLGEAPPLACMLHMELTRCWRQCTATSPSWRSG